MNLLPPEPSANDKISATFIKALMRYIRSNTLLNGPGYKTKRGPNGTTLEIGKAAHARQAASALQPWKVFGLKMSEDVDHCFEIYVPDGAVHIGTESLGFVEDDLVPVEDKTDMYTMACEADVSSEEPTVIYLAIVDDDGWRFKIVAETSIEDLQEDYNVLALLPIAKLQIDDSGDYASGRVHGQYAHSSVAFASNDHGVFQLKSSESGTVVGPGAYYEAREFISVPETDLGDLSEFTGYIILRVQISSSGGTNASVITASTVAAPSDSSCDYPLYHLTDGVVDSDYRGAPHVQLYE